MRIEDLDVLAAISGIARWARDAIGNVRGIWLGGRKVILSYLVTQTAVPVAIVPNGTVAANGAITLQSALPNVYNNGVWVRLPAGAVVGGLAGLYWCVFSSATVGVVTTAFVDASAPFAPYIPSGTPPAAVGSGTAYTQSTGAYITVVNASIPGGAIGANGALRVTALGSRSGAAAGVIHGTYFGGVDIASTATVNTSTLTFGTLKLIANRGVLNQQVTPSYANEGSTGGAAPKHFAINTAVTQTLAYVLSLTNALDAVVLDYIRIEIFPGD